MKIVAKEEQEWKSEIDVKVEMIKALIPIGLEAVAEMLENEVEQLAGARYEHGKINTRWGRQKGSIYLRDQKLGVMIPRVQNKETGREVPLESYRKLRTPYLDDEQTVKKLLYGISMRNYKESVELAPKVFGLSSSNMSRRFKKPTEKRLKDLQERDLSGYDFVAMFLDGKAFHDQGIMVALGVTIKGQKIPLGIEQMSSENSVPIGNFFERLKARGLRYEEGLLFVVDGAKGITKAIKDHFKGFGIVQRCRWHKIENVLSYLAKKEHGYWRKRLLCAYKEETFEAAEQELKKIAGEIRKINPSAAASLEEGLEETLTIQKMKLPTELVKSFGTTNCIESVLSQVGQYTDRVDYWKSGNQIQRWTATALLEIERRLRKVNGCRHLMALRESLKIALRTADKAAKAA